MYLQNCASPSVNSFYFQMRECRISSSTSLLFLGFWGSENYVLYICLTSFHDFHVLFHSSPSFGTKVSFEIANFSQKIRGALVGIVSAGNQGEKSLKGRQKLGEKYLAKFLLPVETIWCCIWTLQKGKMHTYSCFCFLSFDITGFWYHLLIKEKRILWSVGSPSHLTSQTVSDHCSRTVLSVMTEHFLWWWRCSISVLSYRVATSMCCYGALEMGLV